MKYPIIKEYASVTTKSLVCSGFKKTVVIQCKAIKGPRGAADLSLTEAVFDHYIAHWLKSCICAEKFVPVMSDSVSKHHDVHIGPIMGD